VSEQAPRITLRDLLHEQAEAMGLRLLAGEAGLDRYIDHPRMQKPSLAFAGYFHNLGKSRLQVIGKTELDYLATQSEERQRQVVDAVFNLQLAGFVVTRGIEPPSMIAAAAERTGTPLISAPVKSSVFMTEMMQFLLRRLAPRVYQHGVLLDIFGLGVLLIGASGIGKSEIGLELITRGHRLIADDMVEFMRERPTVLVGRSPEALRDHIEVRGLGILNIRDLFGAASLNDSKRVGLVVELVSWERLSPEVCLLGQTQSIEIGGVALPKVLLPIRPGRSMAALVEVATRDRLLKNHGIDGTVIFLQKLEARMGNGGESGR